MLTASLLSRASILQEASQAHGDCRRGYTSRHSTSASVPIRFHTASFYVDRDNGQHVIIFVLLDAARCKPSFYLHRDIVSHIAYPVATPDGGVLAPCLILSPTPHTLRRLTIEFSDRSQTMGSMPDACDNHAVHFNRARGAGAAQHTTKGWSTFSSSRTASNLGDPDVPQSTNLDPESQVDGLTSSAGNGMENSPINLPAISYLLLSRTNASSKAFRKVATTVER